MDVYEKYWIRKNLKIELRSGVTDAFIEYIDLRFEKQKTATDSLEKINKKKELEKNL